jgi:WD40 repeat protein
MLSFLGRGGASEKDAADMDAEPSTSDLSDASSVSITLEATLEGHTDRAWCVAWEPQGRFLATCSSDRTARLWAPSRAAGGAWVTVAELEGVHNRTVRSVAWSPCGTSARRATHAKPNCFLIIIIVTSHSKESKPSAVSRDAKPETPKKNASSRRKRRIDVP